MAPWNCACFMTQDLDGIVRKDSADQKAWCTSDTDLSSQFDVTLYSALYIRSPTRFESC